jgi:hypothetical protein
VKLINFIQGELFHNLSVPEADDINFKVCTTCNQAKQLKHFAYRETYSGVQGLKSLRSECKKCKYKKTKTVAFLKKQYLKPTSHKYKCPCCNKNEKELRVGNRWKNKSVWVLDHDHSTEKFRGWICGNCNVGLGRFNDDIINLKNAIKYLEKHKQIV